MNLPSRRAGVALIVGIACGFAALLAVAAFNSTLDKTDIAVIAALFTTVIAAVQCHW